MTITITAREFSQHARKVLKMAEKEPVFITKWGKIVSVVSSYVDYQINKPMIEEPSFEQLFATAETIPVVDDDFLDEFNQALDKVRQNSKHRSVDFGE